MGDTGALVIGMMLSILTIHFINLNYVLPEGVDFKFNASVSTAAAFIIIPLVDTARIIILRLYKRQSPFTPDKSHIHHAIMRLGMSHGQTTLILGATQIVYIGLALLFNHAPDLYMLPGIILFSILLSIVLDRLIMGRLSAKEIMD
jgi:UDP-N-acetylmuramyl pentapeptide phosphotransferase/UDP-N-acetylglucosamine-1-phosphate transferase